MVAYTHPDCLPFFECTDSPCLNTGTVCEPSTVWCDMADQMEIVLNGFDSTVRRTGAGVPFAKVARSAPQVQSASAISSSFQIAWDTVLADTDNMVNLDADSQFVHINRPGIWWMELYVRGTPGETNDNELVSSLVQRGLPVVLALTSSSSRWRTGVLGVNPGTVQNRAAFALQVTAASLAANGSVDIGGVVGMAGTFSATTTLTIAYAEMAIYWTAESTS